MNIKLKFTFDYLEKQEKYQYRVQQSDNRFNTYCQFKQYEKYKLCQYQYNYLKFINKKSKQFIRLKLEFLSQIEQNVIFNWVLGTKKNNLNNIEKQLNNISFVQSLMIDFQKTQKLINIDLFLSSAEVKTVINKIYDDILSMVELYLQNNNCDKLNKTYNIINLHDYCELINLSGDVDKNIMEYLFINFLLVSNFKLSYYNEVDFILQYLKITKPILDNFIQTYCSSFDDIRYIEQGNILYCEFDRIFVKKISKKYKTKQQFVNVFIEKIGNTKLKLENFNVKDEANYMLTILKEALHDKKPGVNILLYGEPGTGKTELAKTLVKTLGCEGFSVGCMNQEYYNHAVLTNEYQKNIRLISFNNINNFLKNKENSVILYDEAEDFFRNERIKYTVNDKLENNQHPVIWTTNDLFCMEPSFLRRFTYVLEMDKLFGSTLLEMVNRFCKEFGLVINNKIKQLILQEKPNIGTIKQAFFAYKTSKSKNLEELYVNLCNNIKGQNYGMKDVQVIGFSDKDIKYDLSLANTNINMSNITNGIIKSQKDDWSLILYGVSGSGKTEYANYIAKKLNKPIIKKKVSDLQSMWVGECEKNINKAFKEAAKENAILMFDEADCWLRDRQANRQSWETSQTNQFLQNLEEAKHPVIITTNLFQNLDSAALRRFVFKVGFEYMTQQQVKQAFKVFFNLDISNDESNISFATPGDFAVIKKQLSFMDTNDRYQTIKQLLLEEIKNKKDDFKNTKIGF